MNMRSKKRALIARPLAAWTPPSDAELELLATLTQVRHARAALLRKPGMLDELKGQIKLMDKGAAKVLRKMLAEDLKLMKLLDRQAQHQRRVEQFEDAIATDMVEGLVTLQRVPARDASMFTDADLPSESTSEAAARRPA